MPVGKPVLDFDDRSLWLRGLVHSTTASSGVHLVRDLSLRFHFDPQGLGVRAEPEPVADDFLMLRGELPLEDSTRPRGMISPLARH